MTQHARVRAASRLGRTSRSAGILTVAVMLLVGFAPTALASEPSSGASTAIVAAPKPPPAPAELNLFVGSGFRYQDPNPSACTSTAVMDMLNFVALRGTGGSGFRWNVSTSGATRDRILDWERDNDTLRGGDGSDPHGWRNALNYYGWGSTALHEGRRVYDDRSYDGYTPAMRDVVRSLIRTRKPVGVLARRGQHAQMITGYFGLTGDPFRKNPDGSWANDFRVAGFFISDPLRSASIVNRKVGYTEFRDTSNLKLRFQRYYETDSPYDDRYTSGTVASYREWYDRYVLIIPLR
jgi:hypothetical protein